ncbi:hypothetical protein GCM10009678_25210 [Actinomadura kijaniata]|uniref:Sulfotransferase n=1 Tax=Actinomadura namibiensis TaxID=182080 RepID=A0A7W3LUE9_ACTNM|nr:hypothetical protein [Actinomadura namibiensis]MBA8954513.1 hypothetical protein [Actinomadura namibiensis]
MGGDLYDREAQRRIRALVPHARLIAVLRDPVERAHSNWTHPATAVVPGDHRILHRGGGVAGQHDPPVAGVEPGRGARLQDLHAPVLGAVRGAHQGGALQRLGVRRGTGGRRSRYAR